MYRKSCTIQFCTCMLVMMLMACMNSVYMFLHIHVRLFSLSIKDYRAGMRTTKHVHVHVYECTLYNVCTVCKYIHAHFTSTCIIIHVHVHVNVIIYNIVYYMFI